MEEYAALKDLLELQQDKFFREQVLIHLEKTSERLDEQAQALEEALFP